MVSVILTVFNGERFLKSAIESVLNQTYQEFELIVINDGSCDSSEAIVLSYSQTRGRIRYFSIKNGGVSRARNYGINIAQGEFIAFIDQDDIWLPNKLEQQVKILKDCRDIGLVSCYLNYIDSAGSLIGVSKFLNSGYYNREKLLISNSFGPPSSVMIRKDCIGFDFWFDETLSGPEDRDFWFRASAHCKCFLMKDSLVCYRMHANNAHKNIKSMMVNQQKFIKKHSKSFTIFSLLRSISFVYLDAAREYYKVGHKWKALQYLLVSVMYFPFFIDSGDDKYRLFFKTVFSL